MTPAVEHHVNGLINAPWVRDGRNCWRLVREVVSLLGYELPVVMDVAPIGRSGREIKRDLFANHPERANWIKAVRPQQWALALLHKKHLPPDEVEHAGVYFGSGGGRILHSSPPHGVVYDSMAELKLRGWSPILLVPRDRSCALHRSIA